MKMIYKISAFSLAIMASASLSLAADESLSYAGKLPPTKPASIAWGKDPFVALVVSRQGVKAATKQDLLLTAIFYNKTKPSAIINGRIVYTGSVVFGQKVIDIGRTHVILQGESGTARLEIAGIPELP